MSDAAIAKAAFGRIRAALPALEMQDGTTAEGDPQLDVPVQPGVSLAVSCYLADDILNLSAAGFWGEWFPCTDPDVVTAFVDAVTGLLDGRLRLVRHTRRGRTVKIVLEQPNADGWEPLVRHYPGFALPWLPTQREVLRNGAD